MSEPCKKCGAVHDPTKCTAHSKRSKKPCNGKRMAGSFVCRMHGGTTKRARKKAQERLADLIDPNRALREAARLAYSDISELLDDAGNLKPIREWPKELRAAVSSFEVVKRNVFTGDDKVDDVIKLKLWDKPKALEFLLKHMGLLKETLDANLSGKLEISWRE